MRQAIADAVVDEFVAVETRDSVVSAEPEEATRIGDNLVDAIAREAIGSSVRANRKLFGVCATESDDKQCEDCNRPSHDSS